jgi:hypothetical protein
MFDNRHRRYNITARLKASQSEMFARQQQKCAVIHYSALIKIIVNTLYKDSNLVCKKSQFTTFHQALI